MEEKKRGKWKKYLGLGLSALLIGGLAILPGRAGKAASGENQASILQCTAEKRDMERFLRTGGALQGGEETLVTVPEGVRVTEFLVHNGDTVAEGDAIAAVDKVSVMTAVTEVQKTLDTLSQKMTALYVNPGQLTVDAEGRLCSNGTPIPESGMANYAEYMVLAEQHREYEETLLQLFRMYRNGTVEAETAGLIHDLDRSTLDPLSAENGGARLVLLAANTPEGDDAESYIYNFVGVVNSTSEGAYNMLMNPTPFEVTDFADLSGADTTLTAMTMPGTFPGGAPVFERSGEDWGYAETVQSGDLLLFTFYTGPGGDSGNLAWIIRLGKAEGWETRDPGNKKPGGNIRIPSGYTGTTKEPELYSEKVAALCAIVPLEEMTVTVLLDEQDVSAVRTGMTADVTVDALPGQSFTGTVTEVSKFGGSSGGSSKYEVTLTLPWSEGMLPGMNTSASFSLDSLPDVLCLPVAAVTDRGAKTVVYTGYDAKTEELVGAVEVETGASDGEYVQILSGLEPGLSVWYSYYDKVVISTEAQSNGWSVTPAR